MNTVILLSPNSLCTDFFNSPHRFQEWFSRSGARNILKEKSFHTLVELRPSVDKLEGYLYGINKSELKQRIDKTHND